MILLDTDHLTVLADARSVGHGDLVSRLRNAGEPCVVSVISVEEQMRGWLAFHRTIGTMDLKIAAIALVNNALLLTANVADFSRVPDLRVEDWLE